ncbi:MAG: response regulator transcription factor [Phycisphaerales bacterium]|nr:response regulator transcription factor [Phycisphaerales bacterium]
MPQILIVEDEPDIGELIRFHVMREGFDAVVIRSGRLAWQEINRNPPRLVILDLMLPDMDGLEICRRMKLERRTRGVPILIVSAKGGEADIVAGLELGADDYVTKPFSPNVLMARMRNLLRRAEAAGLGDDADRSVMTVAGESLVIDLDRHTVVVEGRPVELTRSEFEILRCLVSRPGFVRTREQIIAAMHGDNVVLTSRTVDVHITAVRRKLGELGSLIKTVRGVGYRLDECAAESTP